MAGITIFLADYFLVFLAIAVFFLLALIGYLKEHKSAKKKEDEIAKTQTIKANDNVEQLNTEEKEQTPNENIISNLNNKEEEKSAQPNLVDQPNVETNEKISEAPKEVKQEEKLSDEPVVQTPTVETPKDASDGSIEVL